MTKLDVYKRVQRAADLVRNPGAQAVGTTLLLRAWENLRDLRDDDFPPEIRPAFSFLRHEMARAEWEDPSAREVAFVAEKLSQLPRKWHGDPNQSESPEEPV